MAIATCNIISLCLRGYCLIISNILEIKPIKYFFDQSVSYNFRTFHYKMKRVIWYMSIYITERSLYSLVIWNVNNYYNYIFSAVLFILVQHKILICIYMNMLYFRPQAVWHLETISQIHRDICYIIIYIYKHLQTRVFPQPCHRTKMDIILTSTI